MGCGAFLDSPATRAISPMPRRSIHVLVLLTCFVLAYFFLKQREVAPSNAGGGVAKPAPEKMPVESPQATPRPPANPVSPKIPPPEMATPANKSDSGLEVWLGRLAAAATPQDQSQILKEAATREPRTRFLELIGRQLRSAKPDDRLAAVQALKDQSGEQVVDLFKQALDDSETGIREISRHYVLARDESLRLAVLNHGLSSPHEDVRVRCFDAILQENSKQVIPALIHALASNNRAMAEEAARQLATRLGPAAPVFKQSGAASEWWQQNANRYGDDMRRLD